MSRLKTYIIAGVLGIVFFSCENSQKNNNSKDIPVKEAVIIQEIESPAKTNSSVPNLFINKKGTAYLTWIESDENAKASLYFSTLVDDNWQAPIKVSEGTNWVVNWADFPSLTQFGDSSLVVNYLVETNPETFAYDVQLMISNDNGKTWEKPFKPHTDNTQTEHGFVSLVPYQNETFIAVWLDGRKYAIGEDEMTLRAAIINKNGVIEQEFVLDERVCDCCATDAVATDNGISVVYRNRDENEVRDMFIVEFKNGKWSEPKIIAQDNWEIAGCPVNGPAIDVFGNTTAVAWFTEAKDSAKVNFALSNNSESFSNPIKINTQAPVGRVDICFIDENTAAVSWMETDDQTTYLKVRKIKTDGTFTLEEPIIVSVMEDARSSGFPKMIKKNNHLIFAWTETKEPSTIRTVMLNSSNF
ncbi:MAG: hypothetical protein P1U44_03290 [Vicingaceae bacterium]|nr:hypothetical protein [Flavobacteriales bacterium]MDF1674717.1 hypothetical protein [Vicingaceae bacterium]